MPFEYLLFILAGAVIGSIAKAERRSPLVWAMLTILLISICNELLPWPFLRVVIGFMGSFTLLLAANMIQKRQEMV
jgi:biotin transporter BioY